MCMSVCVYIYIHTYIKLPTYVYIYACMYINSLNYDPNAKSSAPVVEGPGDSFACSMDVKKASV